ncbi:hypothetical protein [Glycomyces dulcitolivorans]|uniref:hypothetical protein n=1 Tax=Glycomyces dulcitolivorans TaxID=2200759 RepID=UPI000DD3F3BF|nr:hypothetical protein [Glycomyces dulcitolivorans]
MDPEPSTPRNPEEELEQFRLLLTADGTSQSLDTAATAQGVITVRSKRRLLKRAAAISWSLVPVTFALSFYLIIALGIESRPLMFALEFPPLFVAAFCTVFLAQKNFFTYDVRQRRFGQAAWATRRWRNGDRLEYSIYLARLERVRASGKQRGLARNGYLVDQDSWTEFVAVFLAHQAEQASGSENSDTAPEIQPPTAAPVEPEPMVKVGIRWRFFTGLLLAGLGLAMLNFVLWLDLRAVGDPFGPSLIAAVGYILFGALPLILRPVLIYDVGRVSVKYPGRAAREFPRPGYERLEYSVYTGCLCEVRADGTRRRVARGWAREQAAWKVFVDRFLDDHASSRDGVGQEMTR